MNYDGDMNRHFTAIAPRYREVRTTDVAPIRLIAEQLRHLPRARGADIGCGAGRYDLLLFRYLPGLRLTCVDVNRAMLRQAADYLRANGVSRQDC